MHSPLSGEHFHCCWFLVNTCTVSIPNSSAFSSALCIPPAMERWEPNIRTSVPGGRLVGFVARGLFFELIDQPLQRFHFCLAELFVAALFLSILFVPLVTLP